MIIQIYEIQTPAEAVVMIELGVDHIGSVIVSEVEWKIPAVKETLAAVRSASAKSSLIPLFNTLDSVLRTLDYYQPDIVHFCEALTDHPDVRSYCRHLIALQQDVKKRLPQIKIMRSIPIGQSGKDNSIPTLELSKKFEPYSDFFLTDTMLVNQSGIIDDSQPVQGFVGITGLTCDWNAAASLVASSRIPVILAGGVSPANVSDGIKRVRPAGVDSCTLTNALDKNGHPIRFKKDPLKVRQLIEAVREAEKV
ncbi:Phosphoribosylanthranilate isomerase (EC [Olavius sp. associated proteobacterium Delta 1]|nr:Phosphoribosylanthranilate isomerase (EC [Olavius sp. associated proteobacterium Delta 1]